MLISYCYLNFMFAFLKIVQLKKKLKDYEEKNMVPGASTTISSQKQAEFKR